jgi:hypothetical protein
VSDPGEAGLARGADGERSGCRDRGPNEVGDGRRLRGAQSKSTEGAWCDWSCSTHHAQQLGLPFVLADLLADRLDWHALANLIQRAARCISRSTSCSD